MQLTTDNPDPLRIACYGYADRNAGSISAAGFAVLRELLARGQIVDFFGNKSFCYPSELESFPNFTFVQSAGKLEGRLYQLFAKLPTRMLRLPCDAIRQRVGCAHLIRVMRQSHDRRPYDLQLFLGTWAFGRIPGLPVVSWVQGAPGSDGRSIRRHAKQIEELCGKKEYWMLGAYAWYREHFGLPAFRFTDVVICGSSWSKEMLTQYGIPPCRSHALPYPTDLEHFRPPPAETPISAAGALTGGQSAALGLSARRDDGKPPLVLWLGRIVPRKRLDLFLDACELLISAGQPLRVVVAGGFGFAPKYHQLLDQFKYPHLLCYTEHIGREAVPDLIRSAAVVVQPSEDEDFGSSVAEALACGTSVVVGPTNGTADYIGDGGVHFDRYEADAVADAIGSAIADSTRLRPAARSAAERFFDPGSITDELILILRAAVAEKRSQLTASGLHPEHSEGSFSVAAEDTLRCAQSPP